MPFSKMSAVPNPVPDTNGDPFGGAVLKAYLPGTTTSTSIFINSNGDSPQASITANADGIWEVSGNEIVPHIDRTVKWAIFANATDAAANTSPYMGFFDNIIGGTDEGATYNWTAQHDFTLTPTVNGGDVFHAGNINEAVIPINAQTASYVAVLSDRGSVITMDVSSANTVTIPLFSSVAYPVGTTLTIRQKGTGLTIIVPTGGVTIETPISKGLQIAEQGEWATLLNEAEDVWSLAGSTVS